MLRLARPFASLAIAALSFAFAAGRTSAGVELLNVSYDPTRELYADVNEHFAKLWKQQTGEDVKINQSHGGSGKQARSVIDGLDADVVTLALSLDIDTIASKGKSIAPDWQERLPNHSSPYTSTIVFLVRKGNPKNLREWRDLAKPSVQVITPNPKTGGGARWNYLAAWGSILKQELGDLTKLKDPAAAEAVKAAQAKAQKIVRAIYLNAPVLDTGARGSLTTFAQRGVGDVLLAWENEAFLATREFSKEEFEIITPASSILAEPPVAVVDANVDRKGTRAVAEAYLKFLYTEEGQELAAKHYYRPRLEVVAARHAKRFLKVDLFTIDDVFGGWATAQKTHFDNGGIYDSFSAR